MDTDAKDGEKAAAERETEPLERRKSAAAERALAEAAARRVDNEAARPREINGRDGPEPTRYGDWEVRGLASDF